MKKAVLIGATGFVGSNLLKLLLDDPGYAEVTVVARRALSFTHPKLKVLLGDRHTLVDLKEHIVGDDLFLTIGAFRKTTPDPVEYYQIDHDYPVLAAKLGRENGMKSVFVVTAIGANSKSPILYTRMKGDIERDIAALGFEHAHIFRPSMIMGQRVEDRPLERAFIGLFRALNPLLAGPLSSYRGIDGADIARAMVAAARRPSGQLNFYHWKQMRDLLS